VKALREGYGQVLAEHRRLVRAAIAGQRGVEVDTQGDAFFAVFAGAKQAVLCALEIQRSLAAQDWPAGAPVRVRIGIHTGHAIPTDGMYTGLAVHRAARICAVARGGQVLVSQATQMIIEDEEEEEPGFALVDLGERALKDLDRPVRLFELAAPGLAPQDSPTAGQVRVSPPGSRRGTARRRRGDDRAVTGPPASSFGGLLRQLRTEAGLTREELAAAAGLGLRTVSDLERGAHRTAHRDTARVLADALGLAGPARGLFVAAARGQADAAQVLAARAEAPAALAAMVTSAPGPPAAPVPRELPADVGKFTGRAVELAELDLLLPGAAERQAQPTGPVVIAVVSGTAGVGKTALAVRWAHRAQDAFPDGQLYVNLRGYDPDQPVTPEEALAGFLQALGVPSFDIPLGEAGRAARYRSLLAGRELLVVLDNAASEEQVRPLLPGSGPVMVVVTSRDSLAGLVARDGARRLDLDLLPPAEAVALLRSLIGARAETDPGAAERLATLCARLPLALRVAAELAATRPDTPLADLAAELAREEDRLELLDAGGDPRSAVAGVFSWSYRHLPDDAARLFRLLGLHPSQDWDPYAAAALTGTDSLAQARRLLGVLARAHLIQPASAGRHQMHDLLRAYAASQASAHDTDQARRDALTRLFDYYLAASATAMECLEPADLYRRPAPPPVRSPVPEIGDRPAALGWLDAELGTLVSVTAHTASHGWPSHTTRLADTLTGYIWFGHDAEGLTINLHALDAARGSGDLAAQSKALFTLGYLHSQQGRNEQAADCCQQALALASDIGSLYLQGWALMGIGTAHLHQGRLRESAHYCEQALALAREQGGKSWDEGIIETNLSLTYIRLGRYQQAEQLLRGDLELFRELGDLSGVAYALNNLGGACGEQGRYQEAAGYLREALATAREAGDRWAETDALTILGRVCHRQGRYDQAAECHRQALDRHRETGTRDGEADALNGAGETLLATGQPDQAGACHANALTLTRQTGDRYLQAQALTGLGGVSHRQGQHAQAAEYHRQALDLFQATGSRGGEAEALNGAGEALLATGQPAQARTSHTTALTFARETGNRYQQARAHHGLAAACRAVGQIEQTRQHWQHALDIYTDLGVPEATQMLSSPAALTGTRAGS
jgi:tetratricopeptide (TPR) repeat protein/transcriptional regulator with XRE-family HTH domain